MSGSGGRGMQLRAYQGQAIEDVRREFATGARAVLLVLPTGAGKTVVGVAMVQGALDRGLRVLWLAPRRELVDQAARRMPGRVGVVMAGRPADPGAPVQVASIDTLTCRGDMPPADLVIYDEAHHAAAVTHQQLLQAYPDARVVGLTATPQRSDGTALGDVFDRLAVGPSIADLTELGHLVPCDVLAPADAGETLAAEPVDAWIEHSGGRPGFLFAPTVAKSKEYAATLTERGVLAAHVDGNTAKKKRDWAVNAFRQGKIDVLSSVFVFTEGVDLPRASVCMLARGCGHVGTFLQMVGRSLRPAPGKERALLIDLVGAVHLHGLPEDDRVWSLEGQAARLSDRLPPVCQCLKCGAVFRPNARRACPRCAWELPAPEAPKVEARPLQDLRERVRDRVFRPRASEEEKAKALRRLRETAQMRGYKPKWVGMRYRAQFGEWPRSL